MTRRRIVVSHVIAAAQLDRARTVSVQPQINDTSIHFETNIRDALILNGVNRNTVPLTLELISAIEIEPVFPPAYIIDVSSV